MLELDPTELLGIVSARNAILDRIEAGHSRPSKDEQDKLREALATLDRLRKIAERDDCAQSKTDSCE
jgi:hypothetical protein